VYKAKTLNEIFSENKHTFDSSHHAIESWIKAQDKILAKSLSKNHAYNRVASLFDFDQLSQLEGFKNINKLCIISGSDKEPELNFVKAKEVFVTSLEKGYDLTDDWMNENFHDKKSIMSFDFVMCNQVLEHVPDPVKSFRNIASMAKPGAYIWISIPVINRIHDEPNFYSSGYHPRFLRYLGDTNGLETVHVNAWGSLKYKLFAVSRNWLPLRKLKIGLTTNTNWIFPWSIFVNGTISNEKHIVDCWALFKKQE